MNNTNLLTEIGAMVLAGLLVIGGVLLLIEGKIDAAFASSMFILAAGLLGINGALKAPSQQQQQQLGALTSQVLSVLPTVAAASGQPAPTPAPTQVVPSPLAAIAPTGQMPAVVVPPETK